MPRSEDEGAGGSHGIVDLARAHLGRSSSIYYAPEIPPAKEAGARRAYATRLPESEAALVLYDGTIFGSAENGFLATVRRIAWKNTLEHPRQIAWSEVDPASVTAGDGCVHLAGGTVRAVPEVIAGAAAFFREMARRGGAGERGPYRSGAEPPAHTQEGARRALAKLTATVRGYLGETEDVYYQPSIPEAKLRRVRLTHAAHLPSGEEIAALYDDTVFGSAEEGFAITRERLCWKNLTDAPAARAWEEIDPAQVTWNGNIVHVHGDPIVLVCRADLTERVAALFVALAREARAAR
jgi:hypothetical protein